MTEYRVALIAMSGVRIWNEELRSLGMTLPGFIERGKVIASLPSLGLLTLAGLCPPNWEPIYLEVADIPNVEELPDADLYAISSLTARIEEAYVLADQLRARGRKVVFGGLHASVMPSEVSGHADSVIVGEGETVWQTVLKDAEVGQLKPVYGPVPHVFSDGDSIPRYDLLDPSKYNRLTIQTTRGCPLDCAFCAASRMISAYKRKPIGQIRRELEAILHIWPRPFVELADDNTFVHKKWGSELAKLFAEYEIKWFTETDISVADDPLLLDQLRESGCAQLLIGLESPSFESLSNTDSKGWKQRRHASYHEKVDVIQSRGISVIGCFVLGFDEDGPDVFERTFNFVNESSLADVQITILTPFPGTRLFRDLKGSGRLLKESFWNQCTLFDVTFEPLLMGAVDLEQGFRELTARLYSKEQTDKRKALSRKIRRQRQ